MQSDARDLVGVVSWLGAVQSQDYAGAKWALHLRVPGLTDAAVDQAFDTGAIVRTHILRPTWHFVAPADIRWMLALTSPRILAGNRMYCRKNGLDEKVLARSRRVLEKALTGGKFLTRTALGGVLARAGIAGEGQRLAYLMMDAELQQVVCSGPREGKQFTYALLDERAPRARVLEPDEALAELTRRYFASHGPATVADFVWWSGLTVKLAKTGLEILGRAVVSETIDGCTYWSVPSGASVRKKPAAARPHRSPAAELRRAHERAARPQPVPGCRRPAARWCLRGVPPPTRHRRHPERSMAQNRDRPRGDDRRAAVPATVEEPRRLRWPMPSRATARS